MKSEPMKSEPAKSEPMSSDATKSEKGRTGVDRRGFLRSIGKGAAGGAAVAAGSVVGLAPGAADASESKADRVKKRYRESDHVKAFYRTNRY